jgi:hypothetical protein
MLHGNLESLSSVRTLLVILIMLACQPDFVQRRNLLELVLLLL